MRETANGETRHKASLRSGVCAKWRASNALIPWVALEDTLDLNGETSQATRKWRSSLGLSSKRDNYIVGIRSRMDMPTADTPDTHILGLEVTFDPRGN